MQPPRAFHVPTAYVPFPSLAEFLTRLLLCLYELRVPQPARGRDELRAAAAAALQLPEQLPPLVDIKMRSCLSQVLRQAAVCLRTELLLTLRVELQATESVLGHFLSARRVFEVWNVPLVLQNVPVDVSLLSAHWGAVVPPRPRLAALRWIDGTRPQRTLHESGSHSELRQFFRAIALLSACNLSHIPPPPVKLNVYCAVH